MGRNVKIGGRVLRDVVVGVSMLVLGLLIAAKLEQDNRRMLAGRFVVVDGDTLLLKGERLRLEGIDAPELKSRCPAVRSAALEAQSILTELLKASPVVALTEISGDKYYGRVVAALTLADGSDPAAALLSAGLVNPYRGGRKKTATCS